MKRNFVIAALLLSLAVNVFAGGGGEKKIRIATGDKAGMYYSYGSFLAPILSEKTHLPISIISTHGSLENIQLIGAGKADLAIVQNDMADHAWKEAHFFEGKKNKDFAAVAALYTEACHIVANQDSGIKTIEDFKGKRVSLGDRGSGTEINARQILEAYGIKVTDIQVQNLGFTASVEALKNHRIDAFFCVAGAPTPSIISLSESENVLFLEIDDEHMAQLMLYDPYYSRHVIPAGTYKGQNTEVRTLGLKATLIASWKLSDDIVYQITKNLFESREEIADAHAAGTELSIDFAGDHRGVTIPFHPGAGRYYKEINRFPVQPLPLSRPE